MHKKLKAELVSLAHSILQMENEENVNALHKKAQDITEKLALLKFVNNYIDATPLVEETEEDLKEKVSAVVEENQKEEVINPQESTVAEKIVDIKEEVAQELGIDEVFAEDPVFERVVEKTVENSDVDEVVFEKISESESIIESESSEEVIEPVGDIKDVLNNENEEVTFDEPSNTENSAESELNEPVFERIPETKEPVKPEIEEVVFEKKIEEPKVETLVEDPFVKKESFTHKEVEEIFNVEDTTVKNDIKDVGDVQFTLEDEFKEKPSEVETTTVFEKAPKENSSIESEKPAAPKSLNDVLFTTNLQVGLNDRIAFVKHLFNGSQEDFNRVLSQLNSFKSEEEAKYFINNFVKPEYDWSSKEEYELRLINLIERKFL